ncbi:hypothetical protein FRC09_004939 [Ceratobasidium sp. 395]|nr:hypothetical protein FRC09_004939 [Ceratobasidium sp. 395]
MLAFHRLFSAFALIASFALLSVARPTHHNISLRARAVEDNPVLSFQKMLMDMKPVAKALGSLTTTGESPQGQVQQMAAILSKDRIPATAMSNLSPEQQTQIIDHKVATEANFKKWYATWMRLDVAIQKWLYGFPYSIIKPAVTKAGSSVCSELHDMKMRLTVNMFRGMGVGY